MNADAGLRVGVRFFVNMGAGLAGGDGPGALERLHWGMFIAERVELRDGGAWGRVELLPMGVEHAGALFAACNDDESWRLRPDARPRSAAEWVERIGSNLREAATGVRRPLVILAQRAGEEGPGEVAGTTGYLDIQPENRAVEIGATMLSPKWQRTFVNTACKRMLLGYAFEVAGAVRVQFKVDTRNERSQRAVLRLGAQHEGVLRRNRVCHDGYIRDTAVFSVLDGEWPGVKARLTGLLARG
jgi:RimJ/RimL family protein N-acetyltransferase